MIKQWMGLGLAIATMGLTLLSLLGPVAWHPYLELASHFRVQYFCLSGLAVLGLIWGRLGRGRSGRWLWVALFCVMVQGAELVAWYMPPSPSTTESPNLRILLSNVYVRNQDKTQVPALVKREQPDIALFMEVDHRWSAALQSLRSQMPYRFAAPSDLTLYSRLPLRTQRLFGPPHAPSLAVTVDIGGQSVMIVATHPLPPRPDRFAERNAEFERVADFIQQQDPQLPLVLIGDLNTTMWSPYYRQLVQKAGLRNGRQGFGILPTWPAPTPHSKPSPVIAFLKLFAWIPIDHVLVNSQVHVQQFRVGPNVASDHLPVIADLVID